MEKKPGRMRMASIGKNMMEWIRWLAGKRLTAKVIVNVDRQD